MWSPYRSHWTVPICIFSNLRDPITRSRSAELLSKTRSEHFTFYRCSECMGFLSQRGKFSIFSNGMRLCPQSQPGSCLPLLELILLVEEKRKRSSSPKAAALPGHSLPCVVKWHLQGAADTTACCSWIEGGWAEAGNTCSNPNKHPKQETMDKTKSTERVQRLKDNQRGLSMVIYNRDCKMVN